MRIEVIGVNELIFEDPLDVLLYLSSGQSQTIRLSDAVVWSRNGGVGKISGDVLQAVVEGIKTCVLRIASEQISLAGVRLGITRANDAKLGEDLFLKVSLLQVGLPGY